MPAGPPVVRPHEVRDMTVVEQMLDDHPDIKDKADFAALRECIEACYECAQACTACADACLAEPSVADLRECIRLNLDCADVCEATGRLLSRRTAESPDVRQAILSACVVACRVCADECERHAAEHRHCATCAEACRRCQQACSALLEGLAA
jgi:hypothetical protein